ncbi:MAG: hypothetical protein JXR37_21020 [Kiritimatiellae bacterium]|nr:hypothetical protein [Kiritimatiellia bacterium]
MTKQPETKVPVRTDAFASVALWQLIAFVLLICFVWASEVIDLPAIVFHIAPSPFNFYRVCILSAAIITAGIVTVGHTYERQRSLVKKLLMTCLYCHRVKTTKGEWVHAEEYFLNHYPVAMDRGACPDCGKMLETTEIAAQESGIKSPPKPGAVKPNQPGGGSSPS